ncbi:MAG TPA: BMP family ABC transporter substrate-binding protein, partial [Acidimicrobiales bacterium]|nr:BMP family ABC transporter substrate-binding protein [Acidimicrobiales bacterium]
MRHHRWFKILALLLPLLLLAAACGDDEDDPESSSASAGSASGEEAEEPAQEEPATDLSVGLVYDLGGRGDKSFNDAAAAGLDRAVEELGIEAPEELAPDEGGENREELMRLLAENGTGLIFGVGFLFGDSITAAAPDFPDSRFAIIDSVVEADNVASLVFAEEQGSYLVGAAAALKSQTGHIGFIGGVENELIQKFEAGYTAGAKSINPDIEVEVAYITQPPDFGGFNDPARGKEIAAGMLGGGADIVYGAAGGSGTGIIDAVVEAKAGGSNVWAIGVDSDQYELVEGAA